MAVAFMAVAFKTVAYAMYAVMQPDMNALQRRQHQSVQMSIKLSPGVHGFAGVDLPLIDTLVPS